MTAMSQERLNSILSQFSRLKVAVIGDFFLDKYQIIDPSLDEPSIETGLTARQVVEVRNVPGAAGTVTNNLVSLGVGQIDAIGFVGEDGEGHDLFNGLRSRGVNCDSMLVARDRFTPTYTKPMIRVGSEETELNRIDIKNRTPTSKEIESELTDILWEHLHPSVEKSVVNAVIVLDQVSEANCGVVTEHIRAVISDMAIKQPHVIFFADSRERIGEFTNVILKPNKFEAMASLGHSHSGNVTIEQAKAYGRIMAARNGKPVFVTAGEDGILACSPDGVEHIPTFPAEGPVDIVGAGDSVTAGIVLALCSGASPAEAAFIGNMCASVTIHKLGTTGTVTQDELRHKLASVVV